jgi:hypothetical protein
MKRAALRIVAVVTVVAAALLCLITVNRHGRRAPQEPPTVVLPAASTTGAGQGLRPDEAIAANQGTGNTMSETAVSGTVSGVNLIDEICGANAYRRLQELSSAGHLSPAECRALAEFVADPTSDENLERMASIKNSVMNILARQENLPDRWERLLQRLVEDESQHAVIRAYALQHLFAWYEEQPGSGVDRAELRAVGRTFREMADHSEGSIAATALLGLCHLAGRDPAVDAGQVAEKARAILEAPERDPLLEITAFQVAALLNQTDDLVRALEVAQSGPTIASRVSAVAAVGALGGRDELPMLERLMDDPNASVRVAARAAIARLESKSGG